MSLPEWARGKSPWPERDAELIERWRAGEGPVVIEREMHLTNGQVMGRVNRLCQKGILAWRGPRKADPERAVQSKKRRDRERAARLAKCRPAQKLPPLASIPAVAPSPVLNPVLNPVLKTTCTCQWVESERPVTYCGAPCCGRRNFDGTWHVTSWCADHYERVYRPSSRQQSLHALGLPS